MENLRPNADNFKQYAFRWKAEFGERHELVYRSPQEADRYVERQGATIKEDIIDTFVNIQCLQDVERYLYRSRLLEGFLQLGDPEAIKTTSSGLSTAKALIDDRNDASVTRDSTAGNVRQPSRALDPLGLYKGLFNAVRIHLSYGFASFSC
jgi:hypothetical protein